MIEIRVHGRGGQGVVTAAELLSVAAFLEGRHSQAFPSFGSERTGAPVVSFCRIDDRPIRTREPVVAPDGLIVVDATLLHQVDLFAGVKPGAHVLANSSRDVASLGMGELVERFPAGHLQTVPATRIARETLGRPLPNAAMLGAFVALTGVVGLDSVCEAIRGRFRGGAAEGNVAAAQSAYRWVRGPAPALEPAHV